MRGEIDRAGQQMRALARAGQRRREHDVAALAQALGNAGEFPAAAPGAVNENVGGHGGFLIRISRHFSAACCLIPPPAKRWRRVDRLSERSDAQEIGVGV